MPISTRDRRYAGLCLRLAVFTALHFATFAHAQRASENAIAEASDAFGLTVGREEIGLYSATIARGFNPSLAGNLRIDGLYFDQINQATPGTRLTRGSSVHVGISAQGFPFPAPTGVVNMHLRSPGNAPAGSVLAGIASFDQAYGEFDFQVPVIDEVLSVGGGVGYSRNSGYAISQHSDSWTAGAIVRWQPLENLVITPFFGRTDLHEFGEKPHVFIGDSGWPRYRSADLMSQPWADYRNRNTTAGTTARYAFADGWQLDAGIFYSELVSPLNIDSFLSNVNGSGEGHYSIHAAAPRDNRSTSGEFRLSRQVFTDRTRQTFYASVKGRDRSLSSGGSQSFDIGPGTTRWTPQVEMPTSFAPSANTLIDVQQITPGLAYEATWRDVGQLSIGVQKSFFDRTIGKPNASSVSSSSRPWLYNLGVAANLGRKVVAYASFTRGFEEVGNAPINAANRDEAVSPQMTRQVDAGVKYQWTPRLMLIAGVFEIEKPYFDLDDVNVYREVGTTSNRGIEVSLAGNLTDHLTVVAGMTLIDPTVTYETSSGMQEREAIGPLPGIFRANFQYQLPMIPGLMLDARIERISERYARYDSVRLPALTTFDAGARYDMQLFGRSTRLRLQLFNLTDEYGLTAEASSRVKSYDARRFDLSVAIDL